MKHSSIFLCLLAILFANSFTAAKAQAVNVSDSLALVDFYNSTNGPNWADHTNWLTTAPVSTWYGVSVANNRVISIIMYYNNLSGKLPSTIGNLTVLDTLSLTFNELGGVLPSSTGNLANLTLLDLTFNQIGGSIPKSIGNLKNLYTLNLEQNAFTGSIPASIGSMTNLRNLNLYSNQLSGSIPPEIGNLPNITNLDLSSNSISGTIPSEIGNLKTLQNLVFYHDQLSGKIPASLGNLEQLTALGLHYNQLSGEIPESIGKLKKLSTLNLQYNQLTGFLPSSFRKLNILSFINVSNNNLSEDENIQSSDSTKTTHVDISYNLCNFNGIEYLARYYKRAYYQPQKTILSIHQNGNTLSVNAGGTLNKNTYTWYQEGNMNAIIIHADSTFTPAQSGRYYAAVTNKVAKKLTLYSDTIDFVLAPLQQINKSITAAVQPASSIKSIQVYPNPASNIIHLQTNGKAIITLTNSAGKILFSKSISNTADINVSAFANGTYYIQNKTTGEMQKIVIVH